MPKPDRVADFVRKHFCDKTRCPKVRALCGPAIVQDDLSRGDATEHSSVDNFLQGPAGTITADAERARAVVWIWDFSPGVIENDAVEAAAPVTERSWRREAGRRSGCGANEPSVVEYEPCARHAAPGG